MISRSDPDPAKRPLYVCVLARPKPNPPVTADVLIRAVIGAKQAPPK
jgi:hypothetical protein